MTMRTLVPIETRRHGRARMGAYFMALLATLGCARAADLPAAAVLDLPISASQATPAWLGHPDTPPTTFATLNLPVLPPDPNASLLVTVYFTEKQGGFLRITWRGTQGAETLSDNFYEDIGMTNQRSLLIAPATLFGNGTLTFQSGDTALGIQRIKLEWLQTRDAVVSPAWRDTLVVPGATAASTSTDCNGQPQPDQQGMWQNLIVTVPIQDQPLRIEQGVEFSLDLDKTPTTTRLALKETGLALGKHLIVWINGQRAGTITPAVPDLLDAGYVTSPDTKAGYIGWRDGSIFIPAELLKPGTNAIQLSDEADSASEATSPNTPEAPLAVKELTMQLNYTPAQNLPTFLPPHLSLAPTPPPSEPADEPGPIAPWKTTSN